MNWPKEIICENNNELEKSTEKIKEIFETDKKIIEEKKNNN